MLGEHGFAKVYSVALDQEVYLVLKETDKQLVTENDLPIYTASELHQIAEKNYSQLTKPHNKAWLI